jgi:asparagine synthase (glutamine-hydrolysing)
MCGICGRTRDPRGVAVRSMNSRLVHRGPDDEGVYIDESCGLALGARRLSIIDVAGGHQPVSNEDETIWAIQNGEIYNHPELREQLLTAGHKFRSATDTEVLVHLYEEYGDALVYALDGMYAFAIWDSRRRRLLIARDRFGEKPLFYHHRDGVLTFASELTALMGGAPIARELDPAAVDAYFVFGYVPGPESIVPGVRQLPPAHQLVWEADRPEPAISCYWHPTELAAPSGESLRQLTDEAGRLLRRSIKARMISDVPLGVLLSGGIDSSLIAVLAAESSSTPIKTFTVGYDVGHVGETDGARATAEEIGSDHHELILREADVGTRAVHVLSSLDQPLADQALIATHAITEFARREVTVAVGGEGADEIFAGYPRYRWLRRAAQMSVFPDQSRSAAASLAARIAPAGRLQRVASVIAPQPTVERHLDWVTHDRRHLRTELYGPELQPTLAHDSIPQELAARTDQFFSRGTPDSVMRLDQVHWLPDDVLMKADRASMLNSLELRTPFLHRDLVEFAAGIPIEKHTARDGKQLLRQLGVDLGISAASRAKTAFRVPASDWLRGPLAATLSDQLRSGTLYDRGLLQRSHVRRLVSEHNARLADWTHVLWPVLALGLWADRFWAADSA